jgi:hypothetical protein
MHYNQIQPFAFWLLASGPSVERARCDPYDSEARDYDLSEHI